MHQIISLNDFPWSFKDWVSDHSDMSPEYLEETFSSFANPAGNSLILNGTSAAETGPDVQGIEDVIQFGICTDVPETFQHGGHGGCDSDG